MTAILFLKGNNMVPGNLFGDYVNAFRALDSYVSAVSFFDARLRILSAHVPPQLMIRSAWTFLISPEKTSLTFTPVILFSFSKIKPSTGV